jgi:hypothetical protein
MEYAEAKRIRGKSFGTMLGENEGGLGESLKAAISQKTQAKMTGLKEKFDPMNIAKFMTGGSNWAPALLGKLTGRKQSSIDYFSGVRRRGKGTAEKLGSIGSGGGDFLGILQDIESLLHTTREEDKLKAEEENNFAEEKALEKERRHKELMEALTGKPYTTVPKTASKVGEDETSPKSLFDLLKDLIDPKWLTFLISPSFLAFAGLLAAIGISTWFLQKLADNTNNMKALSPDEAQAILQGNDAQFIEDSGGREYLENIIKNGKKNAQDALSMPAGEERDKKLKELGGEDKVKSIAQDEKVYDVPEQQTPEQMGKTRKLSFTKEEFIGKGSARKSKEAKWKKLYEPYYDDNGNLKTATPVQQNSNVETPSTPTTPAAASESPAPVTETPKPSQALNNAQKENLDLNVPVSKPDTSTVAVNQSANVSKGGKPRTNIPLVRNAEETIQRMIYNNTRVV